MQVKINMKISSQLFTHTKKLSLSLDPIMFLFSCLISLYCPSYLSILPLFSLLANIHLFNIFLFSWPLNYVSFFFYLSWPLDNYKRFSLPLSLSLTCSCTERSSLAWVRPSTCPWSCCICCCSLSVCSFTC